MTPVTVMANKQKYKTGDDQFRNHICGQIGKIVNWVEIIEELYLAITFEDESEVHFSILPDDYQGPEAIYFNGLNNEMIVI